MSDTVYLRCAYCNELIGSERVPCGRHQAPSVAIRWYLRLVAHIRKEHLGRRSHPVKVRHP